VSSDHFRSIGHPPIYDRLKLAASGFAHVSGDPHSVQPELTIDEAKLSRRDKVSMSDAHSVERPIEIGGPKIQEV
jgi:hypothetical protein